MSLLDLGDVAVFGNWELVVDETQDYPGDPAPYLKLRLLSVPDRCRCKRALPPALFSATMEREEALRLAEAIQRHYAIADGHAAERERLRRYVERRLRVQQDARDFHSKLLGDSE